MDAYGSTPMNFFRSRLFRVLAIGGVGFICQTAIFEYLGVYLKIVAPSTAVVIGAEIGVLVNFFLNNRFSFRDIYPTVPLWMRLTRFHIVVSGSLFIQWTIVFITQHITTDLLTLQIAYITGVAIGFISNYAGYRHWVWKHHESPV